MRNSSGFRFQDFGVMALIFGLALIAYIPCLHGQFIWDDLAHITKPELQSVHGLWRIWFDMGATQQYYPLLHSVFWLEHQIWENSVLEYHLANILLHVLAACLVFVFARRLHLPGAWLAGVLFALHPVCVEGVAWISEQKSTLSAVMYLAAMLAYFSFAETRKKSSYLCALGFFLLALLSKTVTATLPAALLVILWWRNGRLEWKKDILSLAPWFGLGIGAGLLTAWVEVTYIGAQGTEFSLSLIQRFLLTGRIAWFYLGKLVWPANLTFIYPRWTVDAGVWWQYLFPVALVTLLGVLWVFRSKTRGALAGMLLFIGTLFPALGLFNVFPFRYSYVADHFQYLASLGIIVPAAAGLTIAVKKLQTVNAGRLLSRVGIGKAAVPVAIYGILIIALFALTWMQSGMYIDMETLWRTTITRNPNCSMAHNNLGYEFFGKRRVDAAMQEYQTAIALDPNNAEAYANMASALDFRQQYDESIRCYKRAIALNPGVASFHGSLATTYLDAAKIQNAVLEYEEALRMDPSNALLANNLAWIFATCPKDSIRNGKHALELALRVVKLFAAADPTIWGTLAAAYAENGQYEQSIAAEEKALAIASASGNPETVSWHEHLLGLYKSRQPYREISLQPR